MVDVCGFFDENARQLLWRKKKNHGTYLIMVPIVAISRALMTSRSS
jgi:adenine-specific DNA glycosylase